MGEEEPVAFPQPLELSSDDAREQWTHLPVRGSCLSKAAREPIDLVWFVLVGCHQPGPRGAVDLIWSCGAAQRLHITNLPELGVARDAVVSPSLDVSSDQISGNRIAISVLVDILEQVVPDCIGYLKIGLRGNLSGGSSHLLLPITLSHKEGSPQSSTEIC